MGEYSVAPVPWVTQEPTGLASCERLRRDDLYYCTWEGIVASRIAETGIPGDVFRGCQDERKSEGTLP
jgi:hypothetical protein